MTDDTIYIAISHDEFSKLLTLAARNDPTVRNYGQVLSAEQVARQWLTENGGLVEGTKNPGFQEWIVPDQGGEE